MITGDYKVAGVKFLKGRNTANIYYFALFDKNLQIGSNVVCDSDGVYAVGTIVSIENQEDATFGVRKRICGAANIDSYLEDKEQRTKVHNVKAKMGKRLTVLKKEDPDYVYAIVSEYDNEMRELLCEYKALIEQ